MRTRRRPCEDTHRGFTLIELMITLVLGVVLGAVAFALLQSQMRLFEEQQEYIVARGSLRTAAAILAGELAAQSASDGDLASIGPSGLSLRSIGAAGLICSKVKTAGGTWRLGLQHVSGYLYGTAEDSVLVYDVAGGKWRTLGVAGAWNGADAWAAEPAGGGTPVCFWGDSSTAVPRPQATLELVGSTSAIADLQVGAPVRQFRRIEYGLYQADGRWWFGRKVGADTVYEALAGPIPRPKAGGLQLGYFDRAGLATTAPTRVVRVEIDVKALGEHLVPPPGFGAPREIEDRLTISAYLRNNARP